MKQVLMTGDGVLINPSQITTAKRALNHEAYQKDSLLYIRGSKDIRDSLNPEHQDILRAGMDEAFPNGKPEVKDYLRTQVRLSDGQTLWVEKDLAAVRFVMERS